MRRKVQSFTDAMFLMKLRQRKQIDCALQVSLD